MNNCMLFKAVSHTLTCNPEKSCSRRQSRRDPTSTTPAILLNCLERHTERKSKSLIHRLLRVDLLTPPGLCHTGPAWHRAGVADPPYGGAADPAAAGDGRGSALAGEGGEVSGN